MAPPPLSPDVDKLLHCSNLLSSIFNVFIFANEVQLLTLVLLKKLLLVSTIELFLTSKKLPEDD